MSRTLYSRAQLAEALLETDKAETTNLSDVSEAGLHHCPAAVMVWYAASDCMRIALELTVPVP